MALVILFQNCGTANPDVFSNTNVIGALEQASTRNNDTGPPWRPPTDDGSGNVIDVSGKKPNDPLFSKQVGYDVIQAVDAWQFDGQNHQADCRAVKVAVMDSGISSNNPDLSGIQLANQISFAPGETNIKDTMVYTKTNGNIIGVSPDAPNSAIILNHGSHVTGIIAARGNNGVGITGICWRAKIMPIKVFNMVGDMTTTGWLNGISHAANNGAKILNMSLGTSETKCVYDQVPIVTAEIDRHPSMLVVVAADNKNCPIGGYPANLAATRGHVISVGAFCNKTKKCFYSNYDRGGGTVSIAAPGQALLSTIAPSLTINIPGVGNHTTSWTLSSKVNSSNTDSTDTYTQNHNGYNILHGTSFSAPVVSGAAALYWSRPQNLNKTAAQVKAAVISTASPVSGLSNHFPGGKRLNIKNLIGLQ